MNTQYIVALILILVVALFFMARKTREGFMDVYSPEYDDYATATRSEMIQMGQKRYNRFSDPLDVFRPGIAGGANGNSKTSSELRTLEAKIQNTIRSSDLITGDPNNALSKTGLLATKLPVREALPPESAIIKEAKKCEAIKTRDACKILTDPTYKNCGVCINKGTSIFNTMTEEDFAKNAGKHIGGMLIIPDDRLAAEEEARERGGAPVYQPTIGECPEQFFYVNKEVCNKEVNRQNCKEVGETGGFVSGKTVEGKGYSGAGGLNESCAMCSIGDNAFLYEPKVPAAGFTIRVRAVTPVGTGRNILKVMGTNGKLLGQAKAMGGQEIVIDLSDRVNEGDSVSFVVIQEYPHRPKGKVEVFNVDRRGFEAQLNSGSDRYGFSSAAAQSFCQSIGTQPATKAQLEQGYTQGSQVCWNGHTADGFTGYPMQSTKTNGRCGNIGMNDTPGANAGAWCYGIKPPVGTYASPNEFETEVKPWFELHNPMDPPLEDKGPMNSRYNGGEYEAPNYRGVIVQWEMPHADPKRRRFPVEPSIISVNGMGPNTTTSDGFKIFKILRRLGTFGSSQMIVRPRPADIPNMLSNQYWIWANLKGNNEFRFGAKVPGIYRDPFYREDIARCPRAPMVGQQATLNLMKVSPCLKDNQVAGNYSIECLTTLFRSAGGVLDMGKLSPTVDSANIDKLMYTDSTKKTGPRDQDDIMAMLDNLYSIASRGRDSNGEPITGTPRERRDKINQAALAMLGMELVSPCEDISENSTGDIMIVTKKAPYDSECLNHLYMNAGFDSSRGSEGTNSSTVKGTYTSIGDRFSGLLKKEKDTAENKERHPFATCQKSGTMAPIRENGSSNFEMNNKVNAIVMANGGNIQAAQSYYNNIYQTANKTINPDMNPSKAAIKEQVDAVKMCYGLDKAADPVSTGCGVKARYVRVLRSGMNSEVDRNLTVTSENLHIQIPQLQVFDSTGTELAKGKPTSAASVWDGWGGRSNPGTAVDGEARPRAHPNEYHDAAWTSESDQFWMVDLGKVHEIKKVMYYNRTDCCMYRARNMPIQLLDADKRVVAQKLLSEKAVKNLKEEIVFGPDDVRISLPIGAITPGLPVRIESAVQNGLSLKDQGGFVYSQVVTNMNDGQFLNAFGFVVRPALNGTTGAVSFEYINAPGKFLWHYPGANLRLYINTVSGQNFMNAASWIIRPALNGAPGFVSLESCHSPGHYAIMAIRMPAVVTVQRLSGSSSPYDLFRASWQIKRLQGAPYAALVVESARRTQTFKNIEYVSINGGTVVPMARNSQGKRVEVKWDFSERQWVEKY